MINVGILGANGYTGFELIKILLRHPEVNLTRLACRKECGQKVSAVFPALTSLKDKVFSDAEDLEGLCQEADVVFCCLPHGASAEIIAKLAKHNIKIIDLSADFRYTNLETYEKTYKITHPAKELAAKAVYGMTELYRDKIAKAKIIGNPGCYTTSAILPLAPLIKDGLISEKGIIIDSKSGTSGAGRKAELDLIFTEVGDSFKAYAVTTHRHTSEIEEALSNFSTKTVVASFTPHLLPITRGILSTIYAPLARGSDAITIEESFNKLYEDEQFVTVLPNGILPEIKHVTNTNNIHIGFKVDERLNQVIIVSVLDNLIKGASGQAVQNMNVMFGFCENLGLV